MMMMVVLADPSSTYSLVHLTSSTYPLEKKDADEYLTNNGAHKSDLVMLSFQEFPTVNSCGSFPFPNRNTFPHNDDNDDNKNNVSYSGKDVVKNNEEDDNMDESLFCRPTSTSTSSDRSVDDDDDLIDVMNEIFSKEKYEIICDVSMGEKPTATKEEVVVKPTYKSEKDSHVITSAKWYGYLRLLVLVRKGEYNLNCF